MPRPNNTPAKMYEVQSGGSGSPCLYRLTMAPARKSEEPYPDYCLAYDHGGQGYVHDYLHYTCCLKFHIPAPIFQLYVEPIHLPC